jgi:hypothetical protein
MSFNTIPKSIFESPADAFVNSVNCVGVMGAGIALEFKKRYPAMFSDYKTRCQKNLIKPGNCHIFYDQSHDVFILNLAVKNDWKNWSTMEWLVDSIKSLKLSILENDIKSVNMPVIGGMNGRRGPNGKILGMTPPPEKEDIIELLKTELEPFSDKFGIDINLCIPEMKSSKPQPTLETFLV